MKNNIIFFFIIFHFYYLKILCCDFEDYFEKPQKIELNNSRYNNIYHPLNIFFDTSIFNSYKNQNIIIKSLEILSKLLNNLIVVKNNKSLEIKKEQIQTLCNSKIQLFSENYNNSNYDILIYFNFEQIKSPINSKICAINSEDNRPIISLITINSNFNFENITLDQIINIFLHQIIHVLYFSKNYFLNDINKGYINDIEMKKIADKFFLEHSKFGVILEKKGKLHWSEYLNSNDIMTSNNNNFELTEISIEFLELSPYYFINRCILLKYQNKCFQLNNKCLSHYLPPKIYLNYGFDINKNKFYCYINSLHERVKEICSNNYSELVFDKLDFSVNFDFYRAHYLDLYEIKENEKRKEQNITLLIPSEKCLKKQRTVFFKSEKNINYNNYNIQNITLTNNKYFINYYTYLNPTFSFKNPHKPFKLNNIIPTNYFTSGNINMDIIKYEEFGIRIKSLGKYNWFDHFPFYKELTNKDSLFKLYKKMMKKFPFDFNFMRETYIIPEEKDYIKQSSLKYKINKNNLWMYKPNNKDKGRGVKILKNFKKIPNDKAIITKYISNPFLIEGKKFDIRLYVVITSFNPLKIYLNNEGIIRIASEKFSLSVTEIENPFIHLTNFAINEKNIKFNMNDKENFNSNIWNFSMFKNYLAKQNINFKTIYDKIKDIIIKSFLSFDQIYINKIEKLEINDKKVFQLFGIDIMLNENLKPFLIEINGRIPNLVSKNKLDEEIKNELITDILNLIGLIPFTHDVNEIPLDKIKKNFNLIEDLINDSICEFERAKGNLERIFPLKNSINYYKQFINKPGKYNLALWEKLNDYE